MTRSELCAKIVERVLVAASSERTISKITELSLDAQEALKECGHQYNLVKYNSVYESNLTDEELRFVLRFYDSPVGQKFRDVITNHIRQDDDLISKNEEILLDWITKQLVKQLCEEADKRKKEQQ